uniref:Uncharacterized protein LOC111106636 n=1 Tax=Crassostrea virginica TaxID=6565 RepID=A0A8B8B364_CRAVI|nr:uncharacterized protein LOC111106636 [Crassostrea virginica]
MKKRFLRFLLLFLTILGGDANIRKFHLHLYGSVRGSEGSDLLGRFPRVSKAVCAAACLENARCLAMELCKDDECRITTGQLSPQGSNSTGPTCQLYRLENPCVEGYWDRVQGSCTQNLTRTLPANTCIDCRCLWGLLNLVLSAGESKFTLFNGKNVVCVITMTLTLIGPVFYQWTVIQRRTPRLSGGVNFDLGWNDYRDGFGSVYSDFWMGNEYIHQLTNISGNRHLQIEVIRVNGQQVKVDYLFSTESEEDGYRLHVTNIGGITPSDDPFTSGCLECANLMKFTTSDVDNDNNVTSNCADVSKGGWWHNACQRSNLNGRFGESDYRLGINWNGITDIYSVEMRVRQP